MNVANVADIRWQIAAEWSKTAQWSRRCFEWYDRWLLRPPLSQNGGPSWYVKFRMALSQQRVIRSTSCLVL